MTAVNVAGVGIRFGGVAALDDVHLHVGEGERRVILGPNGAGKSTLFNVLGGQLRPNVGQVEMFGRDVSKLSVASRSRLGLSRTWQISNLFNELTVEETVKLAVAAITPARRVFWRDLDSFPQVVEASQRLLEQWGLWSVRSSEVSNLAYGQQRLLEIVVALASKPQILLLDEPTAGLSPAEAERMTEITRSLPREITVLMIEHDMAVAFGLADTITVLVQGRLLTTGTVEEVRRDPAAIEAYLGEVSDDTED